MSHRLTLQVRLYGPSTAAVSAAHAIAADVGGFIIDARWLGHLVLAVQVDMLVGALDRLPGALRAAGLHPDPLPDGAVTEGAAPDEDLIVHLAIHVVSDEPDRERPVRSVPG